MRRKLLALLSTLAVMSGLSLIATPAHAATEYQEKHCHTHSVNRNWPLPDFTITMCFQVDYHNQADGTGVNLDHWYFDVNNGCDSLEADPLKYATVGTSTTDGQFVDAIIPEDQYSTCHPDRASFIHGADTGATVVDGSIHVRVDNGPDYDEIWPGFKICRNGSC